MARHLGSLTFLALSLTLLYAQEDTLFISPAVREILLKDGATQELNCSASTSKESANLVWDRPAENLKIIQTEKTFKGSPNSNSELFNNLKIMEFNSTYEGKYVCKLQGANMQRESSIVLISVKEYKVEPRFYYGNKTATMSCNIESKDGKKVDGPVWYKGDTAVADLDDHERFIETKSNETLEIKAPTRADAGMYIARFDIEGMEQPYDCQVRFTASPLVQDFEKSKNLIQEDKMELQCKVLGYPYAVVTWYKDKAVLNITTGEGQRIHLTPLNGYKNARLVINSVEFDDAGDYACEAYSAFFNETSSKTIVVRVKDKLAALWPFLGIVGEVIVLCTIIFIYEKRRNKQAEQEETETQEASPAEKKGGVRNRRTQK